MPVTLLLQTEGSAPLSDGGDKLPRLTFDGERIVIGRGAGCDVRLPDPSVTLRHASIRASRAEYAVIDEGSTNGTFLNGVRLPPQTPHPLKNGDLIRVGRAWIELRIDQSPPTQDLAMATREIALALVSQAMRAMGDDVASKLRVVEGRDAGLVIPLEEDGRVYVIGRGEGCDIPLLDPDVSREHARVMRQGTSVFIEDLGSKNGVVSSGARLPEGKPVSWRTGMTVRMGKTLIALEEPVVEALNALDHGADEPLAPEDAPPMPVTDSGRPEATVELSATGSLPADARPSDSRRAAPPSPAQGGWSGADMAVMTAAAIVLVLSVAGLIWLLRG